MNNNNKHLYSIYYVPGTKHFKWTNSFNHLNNPIGYLLLWPHFEDEKTKTEKLVKIE